MTSLNQIYLKLIETMNSQYTKPRTEPALTKKKKPYRTHRGQGMGKRPFLNFNSTTCTKTLIQLRSV